MLTTRWGTIRLAGELQGKAWQVPEAELAAMDSVRLVVAIIAPLLIVIGALYALSLWY